MNLNAIPELRETDRLTLRKFAPDDLAQYAAYHSRADVYRFLYTPVPAPASIRKQFEDILSAPFKADGDTFRLAVIRRGDDALLGEVLLKLASIHALQGEIGYIFHTQFSGHGYASESVRAVLGIGFDEIGFHRIFARLDTENEGSVALVQRLGFRQEAHLIQNDRYDERWGDEYIYAMRRSEWDARHLQA